MACDISKCNEIRWRIRWCISQDQLDQFFLWSNKRVTRKYPRSWFYKFFPFGLSVRTQATNATLNEDTIFKILLFECCMEFETGIHLHQKTSKNSLSYNLLFILSFFRKKFAIAPSIAKIWRVFLMVINPSQIQCNTPNKFEKLF